MKSLYFPLTAHCPHCESVLVWNIPLFEILIDFQVEQERKEQKDAFGFNFEVPEVNLSPSVPIPIALDLKANGLAIMGYCEKCETPQIAIITPAKIEEFLRDARKEGGNSDA